MGAEKESREGRKIKMAKLYFKYGAMGSSKTAQALTTKFNYEERNMKVWLSSPHWMTETVQTWCNPASDCQRPVMRSARRTISFRSFAESTPMPT